MLHTEEEDTECVGDVAQRCQDEHVEREALTRFALKLQKNITAR